MLAVHGQRRVAGVAKQGLMPPAQLQQPPGQPQLQAPIVRRGGECRETRSPVRTARQRLQLVQRAAAQRVVHRPAVVGVDEVERHQLAALVQVRHARRRELQ